MYIYIYINYYYGGPFGGFSEEAHKEQVHSKRTSRPVEQLYAVTKVRHVPFVSSMTSRATRGTVRQGLIGRGGVTLHS